MTCGRVIFADFASGRYEIDAPDRSLCLFDPRMNLPLRDRSVSRLVISGTGDLSTAELLSALREGRRVLDFGGVLELEADTAARAADSLDADDPEAGASRLARFVGLKLERTGPTWTLSRQPVENPGPDPLVSILVPGYRTTFLDDVLDSARAQTWQNIEILVGDDSRGDIVRDITLRHAADDPRVCYIGEVPEPGGLANLHHLLDEARGAYIKILNDDDLLHPSCVERMAGCLGAYPAVTLVTSHRQNIDSEGRSLDDGPATARRVATDSIIDGASAAGDVLRLGYNWIGEPSTTMFRRASIDTPTPFGVADHTARTSGDLALWLKLLGRGDLVYLTDSLSYFRQHDDQRQKQADFLEIAEVAQDESFRIARSLGLGQPRADRFVSTPIELRPWWSKRAQDLVAGLTLDNADEVLAALEEELPRNTAIAVLKAQVALGTGDPEAAVTILDDTVDHDPGAVDALKLMAVAMLHLEAPALAHRMLWVAHELCPHDEDTEATLGALEDVLGEQMPAQL